MITPTLTVIIPAYNSEGYISRAIASCSGLLDYEVIVVDDGSTDRTGIIAAELGANVIRQSNSGAAIARRTGLSLSKSKYIVFLDADDELVPSGVTESVQMLESDNNLGVAAGRVLGIWPNGAERLLSRGYDSVTTSWLLRKGFGPWPPAAAVIRKDSLDAAASISSPSLNTDFAEDYEMIIRLSMVSTVDTHGSVSMRYRLFAGKSSSAPVRAIRDKESIRKYYSDEAGIACRLMVESEIVAAARMRASRSSLANSRPWDASGWLIAALFASPNLFFRKAVSKFAKGSDLAGRS